MSASCVPWSHQGTVETKDEQRAYPKQMDKNCAFVCKKEAHYMLGQPDSDQVSDQTVNPLPLGTTTAKQHSVLHEENRSFEKEQARKDCFANLESESDKKDLNLVMTSHHVFVLD